MQPFDELGDLYLSQIPMKSFPKPPGGLCSWYRTYFGSPDKRAVPSMHAVEHSVLLNSALSAYNRFPDFASPDRGTA